MKEVGSTAKGTRARTSAHDVDFLVVYKTIVESSPKQLRDKLWNACLEVVPELRLGSVIRVHLHSKIVKVHVELLGRCVVFDLMPALCAEEPGSYRVPDGNGRNWKTQQKYLEKPLLQEKSVKDAVMLAKVVKDSYFSNLLPSCAFEFAIQGMRSSSEERLAPVNLDDEVLSTAVNLYRLLMFVAKACNDEHSCKFFLMDLLFDFSSHPTNSRTLAWQGKYDQTRAEGMASHLFVRSTVEIAELDGRLSSC
jgi:hypothetical protein